MQHVNQPFKAILLAGLAIWPFAASAQEALQDIDETMIVIDNTAEIDAEIDKLEKVRDRGVSKEDWQDEAGDTAADDETPPETAIDDYFDSDPEELEDILEIDDDFEDGDEVDDDLASDPT